MSELLSDNNELNSHAMLRAKEGSEGYWNERPDGDIVDRNIEHQSVGMQSPQVYVDALKRIDLWSELMDGFNIYIAIGVAEGVTEDNNGLLNWVLYIRGSSL